VTYPVTAPEIALPELDGKTAKMYRGGKICLTDHFKPLWAKNVPKFGIAHAFALGVRLIYKILVLLMIYDYFNLCYFTNFHFCV
jgi:hypothetical protein